MTKYLIGQARSKAEKKRQKVQELFLKAAHGQRQEAAQQRREEKIRADRERLMNEEDPDKARKLEVRHHHSHKQNNNSFYKHNYHHAFIGMCFSSFESIPFLHLTRGLFQEKL